MNWRVLEDREKVLGPDHPDTLTSIDNLAKVLQCQGMYEEAEVMNRRALAGRDKVLGEEHPDTLISVSNLTLVLSSQGKYQEAGTMNSRDRWGQTSLSRAAEGGHEATVVAVVVALLATGRVDADSKDTEGQTPLSKAAEGGHEVEAAVLLATGRCCRGLPSWAAVVGCRRGLPREERGGGGGAAGDRPGRHRLEGYDKADAAVKGR
jgi:Tetratricopeptide repeat